MAHFVLRYAQYRAPIKPISGCDKAHFAKPTDFSCLSEAGIIRVDKENSVRKSPFSPRSVFYFAKKFCQDFLLFKLHIYAEKRVMKPVPPLPARLTHRVPPSLVRPQAA